MEYLLLYKKLNDRLTPKESEVFDQWYAASQQHREYYDNIEESIRNCKSVPADAEALLKRLKMKPGF